MRRFVPKCNVPPAPKGNKRGLKLKDPDVRQEAYRQYCDHIAEGWPKEAFFFDHPEHSVSWETMDRYISENPTEFLPILMQKAQAARYKHWLGEGRTLMKGEYKGGSPVVWQTCMRNLFKNVMWDREQIAQDNRTHVELLAKSIRNEVVAEAEASDSDIE